MTHAQPCPSLAHDRSDPAVSAAAAEDRLKTGYALTLAAIEALVEADDDAYAAARRTMDAVVALVPPGTCNACLYGTLAFFAVAVAKLIDPRSRLADIERLRAELILRASEDG